MPDIPTPAQEALDIVVKTVPHLPPPDQERVVVKLEAVKEKAVEILEEAHRVDALP